MTAKLWCLFETETGAIHSFATGWVDLDHAESELGVPMSVIEADDIYDAALFRVSAGAIVPKPQADCDAVSVERAATAALQQRAALLAGSDWTQLPGVPVDQAAWATYRQALRDITEQPGFPLEIVWPQEPST